MQTIAGVLPGRATTAELACDASGGLGARSADAHIIVERQALPASTRKT
jgi:hypothetical protein